jgi:hypothetical protein
MWQMQLSDSPQDPLHGYQLLPLNMIARPLQCTLQCTLQSAGVLHTTLNATPRRHIAVKIKLVYLIHNTCYLTSNTIRAIQHIVSLHYAG